MTALIDVRGLTAGFGTHTVLDDVTLTVHAGEIVALTGANGTGKSTLLRCLAGLHPYGGEVTVLGRPPADDATFWRAIALIAEEPSWYPGLTVREHLDLIRASHEPVPEGHPAVGSLIESFDLTERADSTPINLSTGQRQRLSLLTALVRPATLLLLDEPEQGLDPEFRIRLAGHLREHATGGRAILMATHDDTLIEATRARPVRLTEGRTITGEAA